MSSLRRFFDTFGYVVVRNVFDKSLVPGLIDAYDEVVTQHFGMSKEEFYAQPTPAPVISGVEKSQTLLSFLQDSRILPVVDELIGDDAVYWGSELSTFKSPSQFHRNNLGDYRFLKVGVYLQDTTVEDGGQFSCIPGSHIYGDTFSNFCSAGLKWPKGAGYEEDTFKGEFDFNKPVEGNQIPAVNVDLAAGDIIFFDQRLVHRVPASNRLRRLISIVFYEGEKAFNARPRASREFFGLTYSETLVAMKIALYLIDAYLFDRYGPLNYVENLHEFQIDKLRKYLITHTGEQFKDVKDNVLNNSYDVACRYVFKAPSPR